MNIPLQKNLIIMVICMIFFNSCNYKRKLTAKNIRLSPLYSSGMVIQASPNTVINGYADPGSVLAVKIADYVKTVHTDSSGKWMAQFPEIILKKSFSISIEGVDTIIELKHVIAGKIYLVAGDAFLDPASVLNENFCDEMNKEPYFHRIKVFQPLPSDISKPALQYSKGEWKPAEEVTNDPKTCKIIALIRKFSNRKTKDIGIIDLTWPGSTIDSWTPGTISDDTVKITPGRSGIDTVLKYNDSIFSVIRHMADTCTEGISRGITRLWFDDEFWRETTLPVILPNRIDFPKKRIVYLRKKINISSRYLTSEFLINLGKVHGKADYYINETRLEGPRIENGQTMLVVPDSVVRVWSNLLAVRFFCTDSLAGIYGPEFTCLNGDSSFHIDIEENWKYHASLEKDFPQHIEIETYPSGMYNGMLAPVLNHSYSVFVWYGGYNDIVAPENYEKSICELIRVAGKEENYIAFDLSSDDDTLVFGDGLKQLEFKLKMTAKQCDASVVVIE